MFRLIAINFSQKSHNFSLLSPTSPCELSEREVTSPSNFKVVKSPDRSSKMEGTFRTVIFFHLSRRTTVIQDQLVRRLFSLVSDKH
jgi:hypothetical protein